ncbi:MAG: cell division protein FtsL, partial [Shewanellaceae bacterium]|nr:cell division protein FtsL [Shewanellaceae bacterium]
DCGRYKWLICFGMLLMLHALGIVYVSLINRQATDVLDRLLLEKDQMQVQWHHLLLEEQTQSEHHRIESLARQHLQMFRLPPQHERVVLEP